MECMVTKMTPKKLLLRMHEKDQDASNTTKTVTLNIYITGTTQRRVEYFDVRAVLHFCNFYICTNISFCERLKFF